MKKDKKEKYRLAEYDQVIKQIIHWDSHFWAKNQFFLAVETAFLLGAIKGIFDILNQKQEIDLIIFLSGMCVILLNLYLCYVWRLTSIRNRFYLTARIERAKTLEEAIGSFKTFSDGKYKSIKKRSVSSFENFIPNSFGIVWVVIFIILLYITFKSCSSVIFHCFIL
ncbi:hypothetical protein JWG45_13575 [Leptospira sp. 201903070]|uniref:ABC transmembrane type-1 domain-containing protein n=1 Tax=Leptospira ainlahdjerensis TaxID=2810033 RepID=A0ABS2UCT2_9LEPT|nr:hypothetical protein [Leptospira ainlahdjerensis]MBM9578182.1 hypothetical protein [Leptospira ainlahdjerensis]